MGTTEPTAADAVQKRRVAVLCDIAKRARYKHGVSVDVSDLGVEAVMGCRQIEFDGPADVAYDLNTLVEEQLLKPEALVTNRDEQGWPTSLGPPRASVTALGIERVLDAEKSLLRRAWEKQPATFLSIIVGLVTGAIGFFIGRLWGC